MSGEGPRDWSPPQPILFGVPGQRKSSRYGRRHRRGLGRGTALSLLVIPPSVAAWILLWQVGLIASLVAWATALATIALFRAGSGGWLSRRGAWIVIVIVIGTTILGLTSAIVAEAFFGSRSVGEVVADWQGWLPSATVGIVLSAAGAGPALWTATTGRPGSWQASLFIGGVAILIVIGIHVAAQGNRPVASAEHLAYGFAVGDCITGSDTEVEYARLTPCTEPHFAEIIWIGETEGRNGDGLFPGDEWLFLEADVQCREEFAEFLGLAEGQTSTLIRYPLVPTPEHWERDERWLVCAVFDPAGDTTGTLAGAAR